MKLPQNMVSELEEQVGARLIKEPKATDFYVTDTADLRPVPQWRQ